MIPAHVSTAKAKIKTCVEAYIKLYPEEYKGLVQFLKAKRQMTDQKFAMLEGSTSSRGLFEIPVDLNQFIDNALDADELAWFRLGTKTNPNAGGRWFAKAFPVFSLAHEI